MSAPRSESAWRNSFDVDDVRAQVSTLYWEPTQKNENALKFFDAFAKTVVRYADHVRKEGKQLPISMNAKAVLEALFFYMDGKTGRCDPSLDTIAKKCLLSRRTVVRALHALREQKIIDWVRRTVKTGNRKGEGPQRHQTSNAYFIDMVNLPVEIVRTLRQKLGDKLRETARVLSGSGKVPNRKAITVERLVRGLTSKFADTGRGERAERRSLAAADAATRHARMYGDDTAALREHEEMLGLSFGTSASATVALYPLSRTIIRKE